VRPQIVWGCINAWQAFQLEPPTVEETWYGEGHMFNGAFEEYQTEFGGDAATDQFSINMQWGAARVNRDDFNYFEPDDLWL